MLRLEDIQNGPGYRKHPSHLGFKPTAGEESQGARVNSLSEKGMAADLLNPYLCDSSHRPTITLPKKYQPLPPAPPEISAHFSPRHGFPEVQRGLRQISSKDVCEVLGAEEGSYHQEKPGPSHPSQNQTTEKSPPAITSSSYVPAKHSVHVRGHPDTTQRCLPQRRQTAARHGPHDQVLPYENKPRKTCPCQA